MTRVGSCSVCGGNVYGVRGAWHSVTPAPPDECRNCGATSVSDTIKMYPKPGQDYNWYRRGGTWA